jgi:predicted lipoprotein with Yx(FWY)xxD motif
MKMRILNIAILCGVAAVAIAGCSSDTYDTSNRETQSTAADYGQENSYMADTSAGSVMTTPNGMTVYTFDKDQPGRSSCYDDCAMKWPPVTGDASAQEHDRMTLITRTDGQRQWAYDGKPLYTFHDDMARGDAKGDNVGNVWHVVK